MEGTDLSDFKVFLVLHVQGFFFFEWVPFPRFADLSYFSLTASNLLLNLFFWKLSLSLQLYF